MSVYAGFGGQKFMIDTMEKAKQVYNMVSSRYPHIDIEVDGGVNKETASICKENGINVLVAGSYIFGSSNYKSRIDSIR
jgi:ribulose-phosphate 3-epimerase